MVREAIAGEARLAARDRKLYGGGCLYQLTGSCAGWGRNGKMKYEVGDFA